MSRAIPLTLLVLVCAFVGYVSMPNNEYPGDAQLTRAESQHIFTTGHLGVEKEIATQQPERGQYYVENTKTGRWYPKYGVANSYLYLIPLWIEEVALGHPATSQIQRVMSLNVFNLLFQVLTAVYLYLLCSRYTKSALLRFGFVVVSMYATYWFNYLRAQTFEIYQIVFVLAVTHHFLRAMEIREAAVKEGQPETSRISGAAFAHLLAAGILTAILVLTKSLFILLEPVYFLAALARFSPAPLHKTPPKKLLEGTLILWPYIVPCTVGFLVLLWMNWFRFGSPLDNGYTQWAPARNLMGGNIFTGMMGFLFSPQFNIFWHYRLLFFAIPAYLIFFRKFRADSYLYLGIAAVIFGVSSKFFDWTGQWCFGPRYVITALPFLSLPAITCVEWIREKGAKELQFIASIVAAAVLCHAVWCQLTNNATQFFAFYFLKDTFIAAKVTGAEQYFKQPQETVIREFLEFRRTGSHPIMNTLKARLPEKDYERATNYVFNVTRSGYYWFP